MTRSASYLWLAALLAVCAAVRPVHAEETDSEALIQSGLVLRREGKDAEALELFRRAQEQAPSARTMAQIALAEQALGRFADAETHLNLALATDDPWVAERRSVLSKALEEIRAQLGTLEVFANRPDAQLFLDGAPAGTLPLAPLRLNAGTYEVVVRAKAHKPVTRTVRVRSNGITRAVFDLVPAADSARTAPVRAPPAKPHPPEAPARQPETGSTQRTVAWIALASASVFLLGAVAAHALREHEMSVYNDDDRCLREGLSRKQRCGDRLEAAKTAQTFAIVGYAATGVTLGASIVLFTTRSSNEAPHSGALLGWSGRF